MDVQKNLLKVLGLDPVKQFMALLLKNQKISQLLVFGKDRISHVDLDVLEGLQFLVALLLANNLRKEYHLFNLISIPLFLALLFQPLYEGLWPI